jgi:uncharacterized protein YbjT (DUF2867 family)
VRVVLIGGTGLVGAMLADRLLQGGAKIDAILRRPSGRSAAGWKEHVAAVPDWPQIARRIGAEIAVSTLGTTMRAAGSKRAFRAVDYDAVTNLATAARASGARHMVTVSSVGADPTAGNFYLRLKGEMEDALARLAFDRLDIFRPGLLRGPRRRAAAWGAARHSGQPDRQSVPARSPGSLCRD